MKSFIRFNKGMMQMPIHWQIWLLLLVTVNVLWTQLQQIPTGDFFGIWIRVLMVVNALSLVLDATDVTRYLAGDREETVKGLRQNQRFEAN